MMNKLSALLLVTSLTTITTVSANNYDFVAADSTFESKLCVLAAEKGVKAAVVEGGYYAKTLYCNGKKLTKFARTHAK